MRTREITPPATHPHVAVINIDPAEFHRFEQLAQDRREVRLLHVDDDKPDAWTLHVGCASEEVRRRVAGAWA